MDKEKTKDYIVRCQVRDTCTSVCKEKDFFHAIHD